MEARRLVFGFCAGSDEHPQTAGRVYSLRRLVPGQASVFRSKLLRLSNCGITGFSVSFQKLYGGANAIQVSSTDLTNAYFAGKCFFVEMLIGAFA